MQYWTLVRALAWTPQHVPTGRRCSATWMALFHYRDRVFRNPPPSSKLNTLYSHLLFLATSYVNSIQPTMYT